MLVLKIFVTFVSDLFKSRRSRPECLDHCSLKVDSTCVSVYAGISQNRANALEYRWGISESLPLAVGLELKLPDHLIFFQGHFVVL